MKTGLLFSGGADSMACLYLIRDSLDEIEVIFVNTGKCYPEQLKMAEHGRKMCKRWHEIKTDRDAQWARSGFPVDILPIKRNRVAMQSFAECHFQNIVAPSWAKVRELNISVIIRGQRKDDELKGPLSHGMTCDGVRIEHPIEEWDRPKVLDYLRQQMGVLPQHYNLKHSSMDCYDCTAFAAHSLDRAAYTRIHHPRLYEAYIKNIVAISDELEDTMLAYRKLADRGLEYA